MSNKPIDHSLHLPDLAVKGFGGIRELIIKRLGRVTLIAGMNGSGKTTLLDAVRVFADRGSANVLQETLQRREELKQDMDKDGDRSLAPNWEALFFGRSFFPGATISICPLKENHQLLLQANPATEDDAERFGPHFTGPLDADTWTIRGEYMGSDRHFILNSGTRRNYTSGLRGSAIRASTIDSGPLSGIRCTSFGPSPMDSETIYWLWVNVALTDDEERAVDALNLVCGDRVERIAVVGESLRRGSRVVVRVKGENRPVPLRSLGDGAVRLFGVALALANSRNGFLVIDEAENGIHHSIQRYFWKMIMRSAHENNVQVFATTHGWDCVVGYAQAAAEVEEMDGALVRIERKGDRTRVVEYTEEDLGVVAEQEIGIEVR